MLDKNARSSARDQFIRKPKRKPCAEAVDRRTMEDIHSARPVRLAGGPHRHPSKTAKSAKTSSSMEEAKIHVGCRPMNSIMRATRRRHALENICGSNGEKAQRSNTEVRFTVGRDELRTVKKSNDIRNAPSFYLTVGLEPEDPQSKAANSCRTE